MADYIFEEGEEVTTGTHGETNYLFSEGDPVPNTGLSEFVFEDGTGLGGGLAYEVNGNGLNTLEPVKTAEGPCTFYGYTNAAATHGYDKADTVTIFVHRNTNNGRLSIVQTGGDNGTDEPGTKYQINYDVSINGYGNLSGSGPGCVDGQDTDYVLLDGEIDDEFQDTYSFNGYSGHDTDGWVIDGSAVSDITFTFEEGGSHGVSGDNIPSAVELITSDGPTPDGGGRVSVGFDGSLRLVLSE